MAGMERGKLFPATDTGQFCLGDAVVVLLYPEPEAPELVISALVDRPLPYKVSVIGRLVQSADRVVAEVLIGPLITLTRVYTKAQLGS